MLNSYNSINSNNPYLKNNSNNNNKNFAQFQSSSFSDLNKFSVNNNRLMDIHKNTYLRNYK